MDRPIITTNDLIKEISLNIGHIFQIVKVEGTDVSEYRLEVLNVNEISFIPYPNFGKQKIMQLSTFVKKYENAKWIINAIVF